MIALWQTRMWSDLDEVLMRFWSDFWWGWLLGGLALWGRHRLWGRRSDQVMMMIMLILMMIMFVILMIMIIMIIMIIAMLAIDVLMILIMNILLINDHETYDHHQCSAVHCSVISMKITMNMLRNSSWNGTCWIWDSYANLIQKQLGLGLKLVRIS